MGNGPSLELCLDPILSNIAYSPLPPLISGKNLRKVERNDDMKQQEYGSDVASILARRVHIMVSDTESDSDGSESSDEDWSD